MSLDHQQHEASFNDHHCLTSLQIRDSIEKGFKGQESVPGTKALL